MSNKKDSDNDLVAVMLPRDTVAHFARSRYWDAHSDAVSASCKRALRPGAPSAELIDDVRNERSLESAEYLANWAEDVLEHGWEPEK